MSLAQQLFGSAVRASGIGDAPVIGRRHEDLEALGEVHRREWCFRRCGC